MTRLFVLDELTADPRETPFSTSASFRDDWWTRPDAPRGRNLRYFVVSEGGTEVTRVRIFDPGVIAVPLEDFDPSLPTIEIDRIETRVERRCQGCGLATVNLIRDCFDTYQVVAFSHEDRFWSKTGFERKRRADGRSDGTAALYVAHPLR